MLYPRTNSKQQQQNRSKHHFDFLNCVNVVLYQGNNPLSFYIKPFYIFLSNIHFVQQFGIKTKHLNLISITPKLKNQCY